ncbi:MAG: hypothetical protein A2700_02780 [Candidatus Blackburnbacteria bacterium RIFCSPHIGHO2_01_FULL_44_64]|uniref:Uncharacterized protein n=1 Tax=Candidatus Blackburnbacteria bacterium RIFCSPHIGHO2_02_FULL_44_20 TaxID=1797516 RepID=A0A1G1V416_9BACT|nr:MAG: hypothetical protein A2700_02780 [Candidatus Blackburnbacteria bacterium RIFCSPHIGHO2_01_FULL_44_64]OGY10121.1 MAG: hypothetical protein A3D26_00850 [Candidatus Blackburnbacteria bacterium RIFCSPHIGHO2_02_FULL_44_20]OGY10631.1 MAG: hypothetical protein A3E16_02305 [Candidatus Blackburnbacteria bacterium RIFCSPHIGHO2_12_FULL_44_25]OGY15320.1 MAG: hypothetical protein A3A62_01540 [Candidatus Blackburnbacteria bacterium RIFCSPLOWO2_01_FULL_44_43]OGY15471.1 MAG: hypothetical protein A3H88_0
MAERSSLYLPPIGPLMHDFVKDAARAARLGHVSQEKGLKGVGGVPFSSTGTRGVSGRMSTSVPDAVERVIEIDGPDVRELYASYGGKPEETVYFLALVFEARKQNLIAHSEDVSSEESRRAFAAKCYALLQLINLRNRGVDCIRVGLEKEETRPDNLSRACLSIRISAVEPGMFHIPYPVFVGLIGGGKPEDFIRGGWDFEEIGIGQTNDFVPQKVA